MLSAFSTIIRSEVIIEQLGQGVNCMTIQSIEKYLIIRVKDRSKIMLLVIKAYYVIIEFTI